MDAAAEHIRIEPRVWVQDLTARANPIALFYAGSQTEKLPDTLVDRGTWQTGSSLRIQFSEEGPDETYFGGDEIGLIAPIRTVTTNISLLSGESVAPARPIIRFPHGVFRVRAVLVTGESLTTPDTDAPSLAVYKIMSGIDDLLIGIPTTLRKAPTASPFVGGTVTTAKSIAVVDELFEAEADDYLTFIVTNISNDASADDLAFYVEITQLG